MAQSSTSEGQLPPYGRTSPSDNPITSQYQLHANPPNSGDSFEDEAQSRDSSDDKNGAYAISLAELVYSSSSYHAIAKPVTLTMILASLTVVYINDEQTLRQGEEAMSEAYTVWKTDESSQSTGKTLVLSLGNAFVMVSVICAMTFGIVLLYRLRCMKLLIGYMILSSATLLGVLGGSLLEVAIYIYHIPIDQLSFFWFLHNFSVVGVIAIFWSEGIPTFVTQGYLVATSVILAWQLSHFDTWTIWTFLIMLALYDLCAVLTPCGPLKALVNLMSQDDSPDMPGLLYEAELPPEVHRPGVPNRQTSEHARGQKRSPNDKNSDDDDGSSASEISQGIGENDDDRSQNQTVEIPLAIARVYSLPIIDASNFPRSGVSSSPLLDVPENPNKQQLQFMVTVQLPESGGRVEPIGDGKTYLERDRFGDPKRTLWVDRQGKVFAEPYESEDDIDENSSNTIRLGLGDFIFYSVLVSKSAQHSFATFAACVLTILAGLGSTLILLAVYHHALPALPISIFLAVTFYILTILLIEPWVETILQDPFYV